MKKLSLLLSAVICLGFKIQAQTAQLTVPFTGGVPQAFPYSSVVRDDQGQGLANQFINLRITMHSGSVFGPVAYAETDTVTTSATGIFSVVVGGGTIISGNFDSIPWSTGQIYQQVELDETGGTNFIDMGTSQLLSLPYALSAGNGITKISYDESGKMSVATADGRTAIKTETAGWVTTGNSSIGGGFIGTNDNSDVVFKRNSAEGLRIRSNSAVTMPGSLGLGGVTAPVTSLDVAGGLTLRDTTVNVSGAFTLNVGNHGLIFINSSANNASAILLPGLAKGQIVMLSITGSGYNSGVRFYNNGYTYNTRVNISGGGVSDNYGSSITYKDGETLTLLWNGVDWIQVASSMSQR